MSLSQKPRILIADDSEMNRAILAEILQEEYDITEAENGVEAVAVLEREHETLDLLLLDIVMPEMDGFDVLSAIHRNGWAESVPVIMISSENRPEIIDRAYRMGVTDFIGRPFDASIVHHRVVNTILLYTKQKKLVDMVEDQMRENVEQSDMMINILSHIVEYRNGESGKHVLNIRRLTHFFLEHLSLTAPQYGLTPAAISMISTAAALHDIGKIVIPSEILNKPGRLTDEEYAVIKTHTTAGADMLDSMSFQKGAELIRFAYEICRWHHERWDGRGYPDGLSGDAIPIGAQVVALADVYDALTSARVYKPPFSHEEAVAMILRGECGAFNPILMTCLQELSPRIPDALLGGSYTVNPAKVALSSLL